MQQALSKDTLFHDRKENMEPWQREQYELMQGINHFINCALHGHKELSSGNCLTMPYSEFLSCLTAEFEKTIRLREDCIFNSKQEESTEIAVFDDFLKIADFAYAAIKNIVQNPNRQIKKVEVKLPAARAASFTSKTMQWMSKRPGRTVAEKISPENKILTSKTVFSVDTKENRELMYLYKHLYEIVSTRLSATKCFLCSNQSTCLRDWVGNMKKMISAYSRIKSDELGEIRAEKQATQNNKLMCDINYKMIWDAVNMLSHVEENIIQQFNNVPDRLARLVYWLLLGSALKDGRAKIYDYIGTVEDKEGEIFFKISADGKQADSDKIIIVNENEEFQYSLEFYCAGTTVRVICPENSEEEKLIINVDVSDYLKELESYFVLQEAVNAAEENSDNGEAVPQENAIEDICSEREAAVIEDVFPEPERETEFPFDGEA